MPFGKQKTPQKNSKVLSIKTILSKRQILMLIGC